MDNLIIGAGPAGMSCAYELAKEGIKADVIEKDNSIGGFAKTLEFKENGAMFKADIGPHRFFSKNFYLHYLIKDLLKEDWIRVNRKTRQFIDRKFYDYPINAMQAFRNLGLSKSVMIVADYMYSVLVYKILGKRVRNFRDYIISNFGRTLANFNMLDYTEKIWGIPCNQISADWAKQRIKGLSLLTALSNAVFNKQRTKPNTLTNSFHYPRNGTGTIYNEMAKSIVDKGSKIFTNSYPVSIHHKENKINKVELNINRKKKTISPKTVVESVPITDFVKLLNPLPPENVLDASCKLKWRSQVYLFITLDKEQITNDNWIYFPRKNVAFGRVAEMKNFSKDMSPRDKTSLFVEFFVTENDNIWNMPDNELFEIALKHFEKLGFFTREDVRKYYVIKKKNVYPVYDLRYREYLSIIRNYLDGFENLYYIGRPGRFKYNNQDHSMEMGIVCARSIIEGKRYDIDVYGSEQEYFEKGELRIDSVEKQSYNWMILEDRGGGKDK